VTCACHEKILGRQGFTAARATTRQYQTAVFGGHAGTETVAAFAHQIAWLESSFHLTHSFTKQKNSVFLLSSVYISGGFS
jgi:hypothetical protein|tara:strand:+ start:600 stop:839 length:240 start_codon:yes stop_codon:yes gene_type:complete